jgi:phosphatidylserine synthase
MMLRLIGGWLRETPQKSYTAGIAISIEAAMLLTAAGIQHGLKSDPTFARLNFTLWTTVLLLIVTIVGFLYISIEQYFSVLERTQQFGNLKVLGAGSGYFCLLLLTETLLICVPGTVAGIFLTLLIRWECKHISKFSKAGPNICVVGNRTFDSCNCIADWAGIGALKAVRDGVSKLCHMKSSERL